MNICCFFSNSERMSEQQEPSSPTPRGSTSKNPYTSPLAVVQQFIGENRQLVELAVIIISFLSSRITLTQTDLTSLFRQFVIGFIQYQHHLIQQKFVEVI